jgi:iron(III) transport system substrate-binding protein
MIGWKRARGAGGHVPWRIVNACVAGLTALLAVAHVAAAQGTLIMYCGVDENWCRAMTTQYQKETGVDVKMTRMSAGEIYARLRAEKENPQADIWWGRHG